MTSTESEVFIGPSTANWYVFQLARLTLWVVTTIPYGTKLPVGNRLFNWSIKLLIGSRESTKID